MFNAALQIALITSSGAPFSTEVYARGFEQTLRYMTLDLERANDRDDDEPNAQSRRDYGILEQAIAANGARSAFPYFVVDARRKNAARVAHRLRTSRRAVSRWQHGVDVDYRASPTCSPVDAMYQFY
jgi:hypothetical protein